MAGAFRLNTNALESKIMRGARRGLVRATQNCLERAQAKAPVRKIFAGTTYRTGRSGFREAVTRRIVLTDISGEKTVVRGHSNSLEPVFRLRQGGNQFATTGNFRRLHAEAVVRGGKVREARPMLASVPAQPYQKIGGKYVPYRPPKEGEPPHMASAEQLRISRPGGTGPALTARGRYEVRRSTRAHFASGGTTTVGGRLKASIKMRGPDVGPVVKMYVLSDVKDPQTGRNYAVDQEFGTRHHPPHPFLRPALHETREDLRKLVRSSIKEVVRVR
jgi:HK97 gp10 family phage protein